MQLIENCCFYTHDQQSTQLLCFSHNQVYLPCRVARKFEIQYVTTTSLGNPLVESSVTAMLIPN